MSIIFWIVFIYCLVCMIWGIVHYRNVPKPPRRLSYREYFDYYSTYKPPMVYDEEVEEDETDVNKQERIDLLDETIVKYNRLLDSLTDQYRDTYDDKKRSAILAKQIVVMEKLNRALEKREKLES